MKGGTRSRAIEKSVHKPAGTPVINAAASPTGTAKRKRRIWAQA